MRLLPARVTHKPMIGVLPQRTSKAFQNYIRFERFQIGLPPGRFGIILRAGRHYPVVRPIPKSEVPP